ncbi:MAG TPA: D-alanyl-D-alanine carboxypeptidase/D-alanyl-D-alanine-endopeptidase [Vicinamibacterales bacterium]
MALVRAANTRLSSRTNTKGALALVLLLGVSACHATPRPAVVPAPRTAGGFSQVQRDIETILAAPSLTRSYWGVLVKSAKNSDTLYSLNPGKLLMPGSTIKIVTLAAAAERLGWEYVYDTRLVAAGSIDAGILNGDLVVVGSGDPSILDGEAVASGVFAGWAETLKSNGVRTITGRIVGDDNAFDDETLGPGWAWDDLPGRDAAGVSALQYNENTVQATITPGAAIGAAALVRFAPPGSGLDLDNELTTAAPGTVPSIVARRSAGSPRLELRGTIPLANEPIVRILSVNNPTLFFVTVLRDTLISHGIEVRGPAVDLDDVTGERPAGDGMVLSIHHSPPLSTLAIRLMKNSVNLYAETLLKTIGATAGAPTFEAGRMATTQTLEPWGVSPADVVQVDGSGLSRYNYITAETLVTVLMHVDRDDGLRVAFEGSLPVAGRDGTLAARMKGTAAEGNARAKSGTLANVRSLAGYVTSADGEPLVFAIVANNFGTMPEVAIAAIDAIVVRLAEFKR